MRSLVPKYSFLHSSLIGVHFTNGMVRRSFHMAQATGTICFCESSNQLVHAHRDPFPLPSFRFCGLHNMASNIGIWMEFAFKQTGLMYTLFPIHFRVSGLAGCGIWHPQSKSEGKSSSNRLAYCTHSLPLTSGFPVLRFAQYGLHMCNLNGVHLQTWWPNVHILPQSPPSFRFCGWRTMASTFEIWKEFTFTNRWSNTINY